MDEGAGICDRTRRLWVFDGEVSITGVRVALGANAAAGIVSTMRIRLAQWGQRKPVEELSTGFGEMDRAGDDGTAVDRERVS